jgi:Meckel syndrome type 1 protein
MLDPASLPQPKPAVSPASAGSARHAAKEEVGFHGRLRDALESPEGEQQGRRPRVESKSADRPHADRPEREETKAEAASLESGSSQLAASGAKIQTENDAGAPAAAPQTEGAHSPDVVGAAATEALLTEAAVNEGAAAQAALLTTNLPASQVLAQPSVVAAASQPLASTPMPEIQAGALEPVAGQADAKAALATKQVDGAGVSVFASSEILAEQAGSAMEAEAQDGAASRSAPANAADQQQKIANALAAAPAQAAASQPASVMEAEAQVVLQAAQHGAASRSAAANAADQQQNIANGLAAAPAQAAAAQIAQNPQAMAGARKSAPPAPAGDAVEATKPTESLALLSSALNKIEAPGEMKFVVAAETAEAGLRLASLEAPKAVGTKPSGELRAEGISMQPPGFMGPDGMLQRADAPLLSSPAREASAPLPARQLAPVVVSLVLGRGDEALTIALDPVELGRVEVSIGQGKEAGQIRIVAERPETLALLQRDQRELDRSLNQAGLSDMGRSLSFSLASDQGRQHQQQHAAHHEANRFAGALTGIEPERPLGPIPMPARAGSTSLLDIAV